MNGMMSGMRCVVKRMRLVFAAQMITHLSIDLPWREHKQRSECKHYESRHPPSRYDQDSAF